MILLVFLVILDIIFAQMYACVAENYLVGNIDGESSNLCRFLVENHVSLFIFAICIFILIILNECLLILLES